MSDRLSEIQSRVDKATKGPWSWYDQSSDEKKSYEAPEPGATEQEEMKVFFNASLRTVWEEKRSGFDLPVFIAEAEETFRADADFIANAREDVPYLLKRIIDTDKLCDELLKRDSDLARMEILYHDEIIRMKTSISEHVVKTIKLYSQSSIFALARIAELSELDTSSDALSVIQRIARSALLKVELSTDKEG